MAAITTIETTELGDRSYLVHDGTDALVVDPQRDLDRVLSVANDEHVRIGLVLETHLHNDYVTGGLELAHRCGATYVVGGGEEATYDCVPAVDGATYPIGTMTVRAISTPGHTEGHTAYVLEEAGEPVAVFTGGSLLFGTVGRTDLVSETATDHLTRAQHHSARRLVSELADDVSVHPTHGFGSFCSSASGSGASASTIGVERSSNFALSIDDEDTFVKALLGGLAAYPRYYAHMGLINRAGPAPLDLSPMTPISAEELRARVAAGEWVVDLRLRRAYAGGHLVGTIGVELGSLFTTYLGWILPRGMPLTLLGETREQVHRAQRDLARIGVDRPSGVAVGEVERLSEGALASYPVITFSELAERQLSGAKLTVLDVRSDDERAQGHIKGALHIPVHDLVAHSHELPDGELYVHCAAGYRAAIAASLLDREGRSVVLIDDDFTNAAPSGLEMAGR
jgi:hydroxyacylglutathione hydrolase